MKNPQTLYDKLWNSHWVCDIDNQSLIYIDRHLIHEVTSPQAFAGLAQHSRPIWRKETILATVDHIIPTQKQELGIEAFDDVIAREMAIALDTNCLEHNLRYYDIHHQYQGIVHVTGPEIGGTLPGMTVVCGDSHTSTHGAFAALAHGIGTSEVEHVLATQCLVQNKSKNMLVRFQGALPDGIEGKDLILALIQRIGTAGGTGYTIEYAGEAIQSLSMEARMTMCNMSIEAGARAGLIAVDDTTIAYLQDLPLSPQGDAFIQASKYWRTLKSDDGAHFDRIIDIDISTLAPQISWGTSPEMVVGIDDTLPSLETIEPSKRENYAKAYQYMGLTPGQKISDIRLDSVFIGSCTNSRLSDLQSAAAVVKNKKIATNIQQALVVPGSKQVKAQAEALGLDTIFRDAGFEWREPGCSMCLAMNPDKLQAKHRCASTSNRNFEGRQGYGGRTHLVSPTMAAAAAIHGKFVDTRIV